MGVQPLEIEFTLGAVDQDHLLRFLVHLLQQPRGVECHYATDRVADQLQFNVSADADHFEAEIAHLLRPEIEAVAHSCGN